MDQDSLTEEPIDPVDAQLLALLDGELEDGERSALEQRLVDEPSLRKRLRDLQRSWEMLNEMPHKTVDHRFASTTVEVVVKRATQELESMPLPTSGSRRGKWVLAVTCAVSVLMGFFGISLYRAWKYRTQLSDLAVAEHMEGLLKIDSADIPFLEELVASESWNQHVQRGIELGNLRLDSGKSISSVSLSQRTQELRSLSDVARNRLELAWDDWQLLDADTQNRLKKRYAELQQRPNGGELLRAADAYAAWLRQLPKIKEAASIASSSPASRLALMEPKFNDLQTNWENKAAEDVIRPVLLQALERWEKNPQEMRKRLGFYKWLDTKPEDFRNNVESFHRANPHAILLFIAMNIREGESDRAGGFENLLLGLLSDEERAQVNAVLPRDGPGLRNLLQCTVHSILGQNDRALRDKYLALAEEDPQLKAEIDLKNPWDALSTIMRRGPGGGPGTGRGDRTRGPGPGNFGGNPPPPDDGNRNGFGGGLNAPGGPPGGPGEFGGGPPNGRRRGSSADGGPAPRIEGEGDGTFRPRPQGVERDFPPQGPNGPFQNFGPFPRYGNGSSEKAPPSDPNR